MVRRMPLPHFIRAVAAAIVALCLAPLLPACRSLPKTLHAASPVATAATEAEAAWQALPPRGEESPQQRQAYAAAAGRLLTALASRLPLNSWSGSRTVDGWTLTFAPSTADTPAIAPASSDSITAVPTRPVGKDLPPGASGSGLGLPVVIRQEYDAGRASSKKLFPLNGRHLPATLTVDFTGPGAATLTFHDTWQSTRARLKGRTRTLAFDFSHAIHRSMDPKFLGAFSLRGLLRPDEALDDAGLYVPFPYDPARIPVVFVHGLNSDPHIWERAMLELAADPQLRARYQPWYFLYPTGLPIHGSAAQLRRALATAVRHYDPEGNDALLRRMVLVGHSMGGIISRLQATDSGNDIYSAYFTAPPDALSISAANRRKVEESLFFKPAPFVSRVVFVAVPHRGSRVADFRIVQALTGLIRRAVRVDEFVSDVARNADTLLNPELRAFKDLGGRSVQNLSPRHPILKAMDRRPIAVPHHSIIGVLNPRKPLAESTDGVVPYSSSHLDSALSEKTVHAWHGCTAKPEVTAEIRRLLRAHVGLK